MSHRKKQPLVWLAGVLVISMLAACRPTGSSYPHASLPPEVPPALVARLNAPVEGTAWYIGPEVPCPAEERDGRSAECQGGHGPFVELGDLEGIRLSPGDAVILRQGIYPVEAASCAAVAAGAPCGGLRITRAMSGTPDDPVHLLGYRGEEAVLDGGFEWQEFMEDQLASNPDPGAAQAEYLRLYHNTSVLHLDADYVRVRGLTIRNCPHGCIGWRGSHDVVAEVRVEGGIEDGIKVSYTEPGSTPSMDNLLWGSDFTGFANEAVDLFRTEDFWVVQNSFSDDDESVPGKGAGAVAWAKAGSARVWYIENDFHDLDVDHSALVLGGCCWTNWPGLDAAGQPMPVLVEGHALRNTFSQVRVVAATGPRGALAVEGCRTCEVRENLIHSSDAGITVHRARDGALAVPSTDVTVVDNTVVSMTSGRLFEVLDESSLAAVSGQHYYQDPPHTFRGWARTYTDLASWQTGTGLDTGSTLEPASTWTGQ